MLALRHGDIPLYGFGENASTILFFINRSNFHQAIDIHGEKHDKNSHVIVAASLSRSRRIAAPPVDKSVPALLI
ncbi:MAG: hypothetical protein IH590_19085 [Aquamicrobium sp.]|jgi:hypothetical protein|nr:hypothetical protein [Aquamicrobium sp.]